jgi:hypothetical protein
MKNRLLGLLVFIGSAGMLYYNWHTLMTDGYYHRRMGLIAPLGLELGFLMLMIPASWYLERADFGTSAAARRSPLVMGLVFSALVFGIAMGYVNLHLMSGYKR